MPCLAGCSKPDSPSSGAGSTPAPCTTGTCPDDPCGKDAISNVTKCCGTEIFDEATKANGGKAPKIVIGTPSSGFLAETDHATGTITISSTLDKCIASEQLYFELANMAATPTVHKINADAAAGNTSREDYTKAKEKMEYENVKKTQAATDKCKKKWGCESQPFGFDSYRPAKNFDDYYDNYLRKDHIDYWRKDWDRNYKAAYDAKHPATP